jgi:uncharacterized protein (DUF433 family)
MPITATPDIASKRPLSGGFYTPAEVTRILRLSAPSLVTNWLNGAAQAGPTLVRQYKNTADVGFWDLMEVRFVSYFRGKGVSLQHIRKAAAKSRERFGTDHPFALSNVTFKTDRKTIFAEVGVEEKSKELEDLTNGQLSFYEIVEDFLAKGVEFDPSSGLARSWTPEPKKYPEIVLNPMLAHGQPSVGSVGIPTKALFLNWKAEGFDYSSVADWFETDEEFVRQSVEYELELDG